MPEPVEISRVEDPLQHLRSAVESHAAATAGSVRAGEQVQAEKSAPPQPTTEAQP